MKNTASLLGLLKYCSAGAMALTLPAIAIGLIGPTAKPAAANPQDGLKDGRQDSLQDSFQDSPKMVLDEAWQLVYQEYVDADFNRVDWLGVRQTLLSGEYTSRDAAYSELRKVLRRLEDPYTRFLNPAQYAALTEQTSGEVSGVGIRFEEQAQGLVVTSVLKGSPAQAAGVKVGDVVLMLDGRSSRNLNLETASQLIRGESGSQITLTVRRTDNSEESLILTRAVVSVPTVTAELQQQNNTAVGYIRLDEFSAHAAEQMSAAIDELTEQGAEAFVLDLRNNPGGLLQASIDISRMWLPRGSIVRTVDRDGKSDDISANRTAITDLPLAVLVNGQSASSSEIVTGALGDNDRAVIVGNPTFGKALVQSLHGLSDGSGLAVTVAHYYTPDGTDISSRGITPDINVTLTEQQLQNLNANPAVRGTSVDPQFVSAVEAIQPEVVARRQNADTTIASPSALPKTPSQLGRLNP
ncbi:MAG: peptidase S41 [Leptolyngbya foveolarum]|uniref:Peptidase S41 n=1 Tax=Leptolyngbya foveolarum TaxID=47253 RepID=A0A2W4U9H3_9CYAN|nr:MAG: peptidase S41 [Leptolyngbya foveolarum]